MKKFIFSPKAIYTYSEIDNELKRLLLDLSVEEKLDIIKQFHTA